MIVSDFFTPEIVEFIKIIVILISLVHLAAGFILVFQTFRMNKIIKTSNVPVFNIIAIVYIAVLLITLILIISA
jgi:hypothetical protein